MKKHSACVSNVKRVKLSSGMSALRTLLRSNCVELLALMLCLFLPAAMHGQMNVDCTGGTPGAYSTINAALANVTGPGASILVSGPCNENVALNNMYNLNLGAYWGQTFSLTGGVSITASQGIYLYGMNVSNPAGTGISVSGSSAVTLDSCTSNKNQIYGLSIGDLAAVDLTGPDSFDGNGTNGVNMGNHASLSTDTYAGPVDISSNGGPGVWMTQGSVFASVGYLTMENNGANPTSSSSLEMPPGFGMEIFGGSVAQFGTCFGSNLIEGNASGGVTVLENSQLSFWSCGSNLSLIQGNGPVGIQAGYGGQVTFAPNSVQVSGHTGPAVDVFAQSHLLAYGSNLFSQNGSAGDPRSAAIRVDGDSEAFFRGGQISKNHGPGFLVLVNSSVDIANVTFAGNSGGTITCDSSSYMAGDLTGAQGGPSVSCRTPHNLGNRAFSPFQTSIPDFTIQKKRQAQYRSMATRPPH
jgi:hypothetical protein